MTEKEKMLAGQMYNPSDYQLAAESLRCKKLLLKLNSTLESEERLAIAQQLIPTTSPNTTIVSPFFCDYGHHITVGENVFINANCVFLDCNKITIGSNVFIAPAVQLYAATHPTNHIERLQGELAAPITIGDDCWIGGGAIICPGITIGERCVVAAGSVVTQNIPADSLVAGNPAKIKRKL